MNYANSQLPVVVLCSSDESAANWRERRTYCPDLDIVPMAFVSQAWKILRDVVADYEGAVVVCQEHVWFGMEFGSEARRLIEDLDRRFPRWGACGNRGCVWEGAVLYDYTAYTRNQGGGIGAALAPRPVFTLDDNLVLVNCRNLRDCELADLGGLESPIFGVTLSLECLRHGLPLFVDPRLFTVRTAQHGAAGVAVLGASTEFRSYYREHFINHLVPWPDADLDTKSYVDYDYAARPAHRPAQRDLLELFEQNLATARPRRTSISLCCRTQFGRSELLWRALASFTSAKIDARACLDLDVRLLTDCEPDVSAPHLDALRKEFPALSLECWRHTVRPPRHSRADLLFGAIERAETDYIWFVDDDDYIMPGALQALARTLMPADNVLVVADSLKVEETWAAPEGEEAPTLTNSRIVNKFSHQNVFRVLAGANHIPICSVLWPVRFMAKCLADRRALGDYNEDYFMLLAALSAPQVEVRPLDAIIAGVSFRGADNTVNETDRAAWHYSYATFVQEVLSDPACNPLLWQMAKAGFGAKNTPEDPAR
ncbi:MAG TPA: glycosyltransferase family A protein [Bryobacteraceae bacterium]